MPNFAPNQKPKGQDSQPSQTTSDQTPLSDNYSPDLFGVLTSSKTPDDPTMRRIHQLQATIGNQAVQRLLAPRSHETSPHPTITPDTHIPNRYNHTTISNRYRASTAPLQRDGDETTPSSAGLTGEGWVPINKTGVVRDSTGANLRDQPGTDAEGSRVIVNLPQNTRVMVLQHNPAPRNWFAIRVLEGEFSGQSGYVADWLVRHDLPDPNAVLYDIPSGAMLGNVVQNHPQYAGYPIATGNDARTLVMAVYIANEGSPGVRLVETNDSLFDTALDSLDAHRDAVRRIYQSIQLMAGQTIWLPGVEYVQALRDSGRIPQRSAEMNAAIEIGKSVGGFTTGVVEGLVGSLIDLVMGVFDLARNVIDAIISVITGEIFASAQALVDYLSNLTEAQLRQLVSELLEALAASVVGAIDSFMASWNHPLIFERWRFRGRIVGYVLAELALAWLTAGVANGLRLLDKMGDVGRALRPIFTRIDDALRAMDDLPLPGRDRTPDGDGLLPDSGTPRRFDGDEDLPPERLRVVMQARTLAEVHDAMNSPVSVAVAMLNTTFKRGNPWINDFYSVPKVQEGTYQILMRNSIPIDKDYNENDDSTTSGSNTGRPNWTADEVWRMGPDELRQALINQGVSPETADEVLAAADYWINGGWDDIRRAMAGETAGIPPEAIRHAQILTENMDRLPQYTGSAIRGITVPGSTVAEITANILNAGDVEVGDVVDINQLTSFFARNDNLPYRSPTGMLRYDGVIDESNVVYMIPNQPSAIAIGNLAQGEVVIPPGNQFVITERLVLTRQERSLLPPSNPLYVDPNDTNFGLVPENTIVITLRANQ